MPPTVSLNAPNSLYLHRYSGRKHQFSLSFADFPEIQLNCAMCGYKLLLEKPIHIVSADHDEDQRFPY